MRLAFDSTAFWQVIVEEWDARLVRAKRVRELRCVDVELVDHSLPAERLPAS